jgi:cytochrome P450
VENALTAADILEPYDGVMRPAAPVPESKPLSALRFLYNLSRNPITAFSDVMYDEPYIYHPSRIRHFLMVNDPEGVKHVTLDNASNYLKSDQAQKRLRPAIGNGLVTAEGASWRFQRRTAAPMFQMRRVTGFAPVMAAATEELLSRWSALPDGSEIEVASEMMRLTYDIISRTVFSNEVKTDYTKMSEALATYLDTLGRVDILSVFGMPDWVPTPNRLRARAPMRFFRQELEALIAQRRARLERDPASMPDDLLTLLLTTHDPEGGALFSDAEVYDNVATFFFAGHETTANALAWTFYLLSQFQDEDSRVAKEASRVLNGRATDAEDVSKLLFTRMTIEESMRLYPPAPLIGRDAINADTVCGTAIQPKTAVLISPWVLHRHRRLWDVPDYFVPERFAPGAREKIHRFAYLPFGAGPRICIGMAFAMQEAIIILSMIAQRFRLELSPGHPVEPLSRITLRPKYGLKMKLHRR